MDIISQAAAVFAAVALSADISPKNSLTLKGEYVDVSAASQVIAVVPPWRGERFDSRDPLDVDRTATGVFARQTRGRCFDEFAVDQYSAERLDGKTLITLKATLKQDLPTRMFYQAMIIPDYLMTNADYSCLLDDGTTVEVRTAPAPDPASEVNELVGGIRSITLRSYYGELTVKVLEGPPMRLVDRRADSIYNPVKGFEIGANWEVVFGEPVVSVLEVEFRERRQTPPPILSPAPGATADKTFVNNLARPVKGSFRSVPPPREMKLGNGMPFVVKPGVEVRINGIEDEVELDRLRRAAVRVLSPAFGELTFEPSPRGATRRITVNVIDAPDENPEKYTMNVTENRVGITANSPRAAFHAFHRLMMQIDGGGIPQLEITDYPEYPLRGIHLLLDEDSVEVSGAMIEHLFAPLGINALITECQYVKWNVSKPLHQSWGATPEQVRELVKKAEDNYMEVIPLFQTLGHSEWLFANGQNLDWAEDPDHPYAYNPYAPGLYDFIDAMLEEILDAFNHPKRLHIGHDEVDNQAVKDCRWPCRPENVERGARELLRHDLEHFRSLSEKHGFDILMWHDMLMTKEECPENGAGGEPHNLHLLRKELPRDVNLVFWRYTSGYTFDDVDIAIDEGFNPPIGATWYDLPNIVALCRHGSGGKMSGMLQTTWTGYHGNKRAVRYEFAQMHPYAYLAIFAWDPWRDPLTVDSADIFCNLMEPARPQNDERGCTVDISQFANVAIRDNAFMSGELFGLDELPLPTLEAGGVLFRIAEARNAPAAITVKSRTAPDAPEKSEAVPLNLKADKLYFLHTTLTSPGAFDQPCANYIVRYTDGSETTVPVRYGVDAGALKAPINFDLSPLRAYQWKHDGSTNRLWYMTWRNPQPEKTIESVSLQTVNGKDSFYWFALSAGNAEVE